MWEIVRLILTSLLRWVVSLFSALILAFVNFMKDFFADVIDDITLWVWSKMTGISIDIPTVGEALSHLPREVREVLYLIGIPECFRIMSVAIAAKSMYWGWQWYKFLRGGW